MNVIKVITVTDSFLSMDKNIRGCQQESFDDCMTEKYINNLKNFCQCLPFQLRLYEEVCITVITCCKLMNNGMLQTPLCSPEHLDCITSIKYNSSDCLQKCSGMQVTSYDKQDIEDRGNVGFMKLVEYLRDRDGGTFYDISSVFKGSQHDDINYNFIFSFIT